MAGDADIQAIEIDPVRRQRGLKYIALAVGAVGFCLAIQTALNTNYLVSRFDIKPESQGMLEAVRESCGITAFFALAILAGLAEPLVGSGMLLMVAAGLGAYAFIPDVAWVIPMSLIWSMGLHVWMPLPQSITLSLAEPDRRGFRLGQVQMSGFIGSGLGLLAALALLNLRTLTAWCGLPAGNWIGVLSDLRVVFLVGGLAAVVAAAFCLRVPRDLKTPGPRLVIRKKYGLYYLLCFLEGWRKQVFMCLAPYLLVKVYHASAATMVVLAIIIQTIGFLCARKIGRLVDRINERAVLVTYYSLVIPVFVGYAFIDNLYALYALFVLDSALFMFNVATTTYVSRIAPKAEYTPTLSAGVAFNHISAVTMPLLGGLIWMWFGREYAFLMGGVGGIFSILAASRVPRRVVLAQRQVELTLATTPAATVEPARNPQLKG